MRFFDTPKRKTTLGHRLRLPLSALLIFLALNAPPASADHYAGQAPQPSVEPSTLNLDNSQIDPNAPDLDYIWQNGYVVDNVTYKGFQRLRARPGFVWQQGNFSNGVWIPPHWVPTRNRVDVIWVRGHRGPDGYWAFGHWRRGHRHGFSWAEGYYVNRLFIAGYWRPSHQRSGYFWVRGHRAPTGIWIPGFWRPRVRVGFVWVSGRFRYGRWVRAHWQPIRPRSGFLWVTGYYGPRGVWMPGIWRPLHRAGYYWAPGHWRAGAWIRGGWLFGRRPRIVRRHRVYRVPAIRRHRSVRARHVYRPRKQKIRKHQREDRREERREDRQQRRRRKNRR